MSKIAVLLLVVFLFIGCAPTCQEIVENNFRNKAYDLVILSKDYSTRNVVFYGRNPKGQLDTFEESGVGSIFKLANIGDSIKKKKGEIALYLIKKDSIIKFPCDCGQSEIEYLKKNK